ncbi:hypothetical protein TFLX_01301 [Thermoflexales bacterium]|nr:hypothetical protein TFLX_01301 [Thermoflexales bacterium]
MNEAPETMQYDVNLPKPRTRKVLAGVLAVVLLVAVVGAAAAAIANRTAQGQADPTASVMPANTMLYFSMNTHTEKLPNFNVIADAWKDSKEARQIAAGLELAFTQAGLNWEEDLQSWLGNRVAMGLIDFGGKDDDAERSFSYRMPFFVVAVHTKDRAKSDAVLANVLEQFSKSSHGSIETETYRNTTLTYIKSDSKFMPESGAFATVNDVVVFTLSLDNLKAAINASLDNQNLAASANYKTVMSTLPEQTAGTFYMDFPAYMNEYFKMFEATSKSTEEVFDNIYTSVYSNTDATPDPEILKQQEERQRQREEARLQQEQQLQQLHDLMQAMGGMGMVMTYEPTGIRFDLAMQYDLTKMPENWRKYVDENQTPASNRIFGSLPASTIVALNGNMQKAWGMLLDPDYWAMSLSSLPGMNRDEIASKLAEFQKLTGVDLKADFFDLLNGEMAIVMLPKTEQTRSKFGFSVPFQFAALFDSSDGAKASSSLDKLVQAVSALAGKNSVKWQSLSGLPYSVVLDPDGKPMLTYGVVDGRLVIGTDSNTLLSIDNAEQAPLSNSELFKQATGLLPGNRLNTFFMNFQPLWDWLESQAKGDVGAGVEAVLNYLSHFKWMSSGSEVPANGLQRGSLHIGISQ